MYDNEGGCLMKRFFIAIILVLSLVFCMYNVTFAEVVSEQNELDNEITIKNCSNSEYVSMFVQLGDVYMENFQEYEISKEDEIIVNASSENGPIAFTGYFFMLVNPDEYTEEQIENFKIYEDIVDVYSSTLTINVPNVEIGTKLLLWIEAVDVTDDGTDNTLTKTGWQGFYLNVIE